VPYLEQIGFECTLRCYHPALVKQVNHYDSVILQKKLLSWWQYWNWKRIKPPLFFDIDDAVFLRDKLKKGSYRSATRKRRFHRMLNLSKTIVCGNDYLADYCKQHTNSEKRITVIPSPIPHQVQQHSDKNGQKSVSCLLRVGWVGTGGNLPMLMGIIPSLEAVFRVIPYELHVISNKPLAVITELPIVNHVWSLEKQDGLVASFDIGLMPMEETPWTKGKCAYKLLQYMAANVVAVGDAIGMNKVLIESGVNGVLIADDWVKPLVDLLGDDKARKRIAAKGRETVVNGYTYAHIADQWANVLRS
jgi:glycosyltransferase involved in cell wall biosynthesis